MLATGGQAKAQRQGQGVTGALRLPRRPAMTLVWRRDRWMHLVLGLAGALSFPFMVAAAIATGLPFGVASSLAVSHLAAAVPGIPSAERLRLSRLVSGLAVLWAMVCVAAIGAGIAPVFGWEAAFSLAVAACPGIADVWMRQRKGRSQITSRDIACLETFAVGEAVIITDRQGRLLGSTWAARRLVDGLVQMSSSDIVQIAELADRPALSSALLRSARQGSVEECDIRLANDMPGKPVAMTVKPVGPDRLAVMLRHDLKDLCGRLLVSDPVQQAKSGGFGHGGKSAAAGRIASGCAGAGVNVGETVEFALRLARADADRSGISIDYSCVDRFAETACDRRALRQIVINLVNNAIKFSNHDGQVSVEVRKLPGSALIRISDKGIGIAEADQERIFAFRGRSGNEDRKGYGLGLSIVSDLVDAAGGTIVLSSKLGVGTIVDVRLPLVGDHNRAAVGPVTQFWQLAAE